MPNEYMQTIYDRAEALMIAYCRETDGIEAEFEDDPACYMSCLIADLMHLAVRKELDLDRIQRLAGMHFSAEQLGEVDGGG